MRRVLPEWVDVESRMDIPDEDLTEYSGIPATTVLRALNDMRDRMPPDRWVVLVDQARRREFIDGQELPDLRHRKGRVA